MSEPFQQHNAPDHGEPEAPPPNRRSFMKLATHGLGAFFTLLIGAPVVAYLIDPRNKKADKAGFRTVAKLEDLPKGKPVQRTIRDIRYDSWTLHPNDVIGRVWLIRHDDDSLTVLSTICPHLGCSVNYEAKEDLFKCPCHNGTFELSGKKKEGGAENPAPRGMDDLQYKIEIDPENPGEENRLVKVKYESFAQGESTQKKRT